MPKPIDLRRRNALWRKLRETPYPSPAFEVALAELAALIGWNRARILAGLGLEPEPQDPS